MNVRRFFLYLLIGSVAVSALIGIGVLLFGDFGSVEVRVLFTTLTVTYTSIFGLACGALLESGRARLVPLAGISASVLSALMAFLIIWDILDDSEPFTKSFLSALIVSGSCALYCLLSLARLDRRFAWTRIAAAVCIALLSSILLFLIWAELEGDGDIVYRIIGVLGILIASLTVVTPVLHKLSSGQSDVENIDAQIAALETKIADLRAMREKIAGSGTG